MRTKPHLAKGAAADDVELLKGVDRHLRAALAQVLALELRRLLPHGRLLCLVGAIASVFAFELLLTAGALLAVRVDARVALLEELLGDDALVVLVHYLRGTSKAELQALGESAIVSALRRRKHAQKLRVSARSAFRFA